VIVEKILEETGGAAALAEQHAAIDLDPVGEKRGEAVVGEGRVRKDRLAPIFTREPHLTLALNPLMR
jgi:hypothetical protein